MVSTSHRANSDTTVSTNKFHMLGQKMYHVSPHLGTDPTASNMGKRWPHGRKREKTVAERPKRGKTAKRDPGTPVTSVTVVTTRVYHTHSNLPCLLQFTMPTPIYHVLQNY